MAVSARAIERRSPRYEIQRELARGGMGVVYSAIDRTTGRLLALKRGLVDRSGASPSLVRTLLEREYRTLCALRHPYIIEVYDFGVDEDGPYYTMELLDGSDLRAKCPLPWREVCSHLRDVASSLALLHSRRLLHGDVSVANIRLTGEGRARLIDFGTLVSFGPSTLVAGSPPTTPREVLEAGTLDQRADLYSLGASAYYALAGRHAYPATMLALLPALWAQGRPPPPSRFVADIPPELDELVLSLIECDRTLRPNSAAEVIDRLEVIAGLTPDSDPRVLRSYLNSTVVVGRAGPKSVLSEKLKSALSGRSAGVLIEGASGLGKSLLLEELAQEARIAGMRVLTLHARAHSGEWSVWTALLREAELEDAVSGDPAATFEAAATLLVDLTKTSPLLIKIEDLEAADTRSLAAIAHLAKSTGRSRLLLLATLDPSHPQAERPALELLRSRLSSLKLDPLDEKATHDFVIGLFGEVPSTSPLATFLYDLAAGNPQTYRAIIDHLIEQGRIRYVAGLWVLPTAYPQVGQDGLDLDSLVAAAFERRIAHWGAPLRALAERLSASRRAFDLALCEAVAGDDWATLGQNVPHLVGELVREGILVDQRGSYTFARQADQHFFYSRLGSSQKQRHHLRFGQYLAERFGADPRRAFEIGFHFLCAGELKRARKPLNKNVETALRDPDMLILAVPDLWALLAHQRAAGASDEEVQFIEGMLILAGYYADPLVYDKFGERVCRVMHRTMGFALASRLLPFLGRHLALAVGMLTAWVRSLFKPYLVNGGSFSASVLTFIGVCVSMNAGASARFDRRVPPLLRELLHVMSKLGRYNVLTFLYDQIEMSDDLIYGRLARGRAGILDQLERLPRLPLLEGESEHQLRVGLLAGLVMNSITTEGSDIPGLIEQIDASGGKHDRLQAQFLRSIYHLFRGDIATARREEQRFDEMCAQFNSRWVKDMCAVYGFAPYHLTADVLGLKRVLHRIELLLPLAPQLSTPYAVVHAMYEGHRGRPDLSLRRYDELGEKIAPFADSCWSLACGHKAECLNALGRHAEALAFCTEMRSHLTEADRAYVFSYQQLERESALALAALGRFDEAVALADKLLAESASGKNPLIHGLLHLDRARIAQRANDPAAFEKHAAAAKAELTSTQNPSAVAKVKRLLDTVRGTADGGERGDVSGITLHELADPVRRSKAARVLNEIVATVQPRSARLYLLIYSKAVLCAQHGQDDVHPLLEPEISKLAGTLDGERREPVISQVLGQVPTELLRTGSLVPLIATLDDGQSQLVGLLALVDCAHPEAVAHLDLSLLASEFVEADEETEVGGDDSATSVESG